MYEPTTIRRATLEQPLKWAREFAFVVRRTFLGTVCSRFPSVAIFYSAKKFHRVLEKTACVTNEICVRIALNLKADTLASTSGSFSVFEIVIWVAVCPASLQSGGPWCLRIARCAGR